jgi:hypothetical protein
MELFVSVQLTVDDKSLWFNGAPRTPLVPLRLRYPVGTGLALRATGRRYHRRVRLTGPWSVAPSVCLISSE